MSGNDLFFASLQGVIEIVRQHVDKLDARGVEQLVMAVTNMTARMSPLSAGSARHGNMRRSVRSQVRVSPTAAGALNVQPSALASASVTPVRVKARWATAIPASRMPGRTKGLRARRKAR